ncbi:hypothetical protein AB6A40_004606 [Gnathostoma spinigerum]|uniref:Rhodanese domain-containing protein n=1 Tax=Gnathostoma spinigerum TaxID=75299 RepID=A0ABD6EMF4_9BILA
MSPTINVPQNIPSEIDAASLAQILCDDKRRHSVVIVDTRCFIAYNVSHIRSAINAFYSKMIRRRLYRGKVCDSLMLSQLGEESCGLSVKDLVLYSSHEHEHTAMLSTSLSTSSSCVTAQLKRKCASVLADDSPSKFLRTLHEKLDSAKRFRRVVILRGEFIHNTFYNDHHYRILINAFDVFASVLAQYSAI